VRPQRDASGLHRLEAHPAFQPTGMAFMRLVAPLIEKALRAAFDRERANTPRISPVQR
jgi:hypothetical protein